MKNLKLVILLACIFNMAITTSVKAQNQPENHYAYAFAEKFDEKIFYITEIKTCSLENRNVKQNRTTPTPYKAAQDFKEKWTQKARKEFELGTNEFPQVFWFWHPDKEYVEDDRELMLKTKKELGYKIVHITDFEYTCLTL